MTRPGRGESQDDLNKNDKYKIHFFTHLLKNIVKSNMGTILNLRFKGLEKYNCEPKEDTLRSLERVDTF